MIEELVGIGWAVDEERVIADEDRLADGLGDGFRRCAVESRRHGSFGQKSRR